MNYYAINDIISTFFEITAINEPDLNGVELTPMIILSVVLLTFSILFPCLIWFLRNFIRIILKKNYDGFNRSLKWITLACLILFICSIILIILTVRGIV
ncbi:MAG: hypothetical protein ACRCW3_01665 [Metamycoplasmataceae bacterium]